MLSKRLTVAASLVAVFGTRIAAQGGSYALAALKAQAEIDAAEASGDKTAYAAFLTDDFTWVDTTGRLRDKKTVVNELQPATGTPGKSAAITTGPYASGVVMIFTRLNADGRQTRVLRLWVLRGNQWLLAAHQGVAVNKPAAPATVPSSPLPPNSGAATEIQTIAKAIDAVAEANANGDAPLFSSLVTNDFVAIQGTGRVTSKQQRIAEIQQDGPQQNQGTWVESSTRIHGDLAVTTRSSKTSRQTIIHAKQGGRWLRAAVINTPIAGG